LVETLEEHHHVRILDEAVEAARQLSHPYISGRPLPDKAGSVLDTARARGALGQFGTPPPVQGCRRPVAPIDTPVEILERESLTGAQYGERLDALAQEKTAATAQLAELEARWTEEKRLIAELRALRDKLEAHAASARGTANGAANGQLAPGEVERLQ